MDRARWQGLGLFLFIPLVLVLLTRPPERLGAGWSLVLALAIIAAHRRIARPWALRRAGERSLWSGAAVTLEERRLLCVASGAERVSFAVANAEEGRTSRRFLSFACRHGLALRLGVFVPLLVLIASVAWTSVTGGELFAGQRTAALIFFQGGVATTVLATALLHVRSAGVRIDDEYPFPFPIHNLALVGIRNTLAVFVAVGCYWLGLSIYRLAT